MSYASAEATLQSAWLGWVLLGVMVTIPALGVILFSVALVARAVGATR